MLYLAVLCSACFRTRKFLCSAERVVWLHVGSTFLRNILIGGTLGDRPRAFTIMAQGAPLHNI